MRREPGRQRTPFDSYEDIAKQELSALKRLSVREAARQLEVLLRIAPELKKRPRWKG